MADWENEESLEETVRVAGKPQAPLNQITPGHVCWCLGEENDSNAPQLLIYISDMLCTILYKQNQSMSNFYFIQFLVCFIYPISFHIQHLVPNFPFQIYFYSCVFVCVCVCVSLCIPHASKCLEKSAECNRSPGTRFTDCNESFDAGLGNHQRKSKHSQPLNKFLQSHDFIF